VARRGIARSQITRRGGTWDIGGEREETTGGNLFADRTHVKENPERREEGEEERRQERDGP